MFEVPASKRSVKQDVFEFQVDGKKHTVVSAKFLNGSQMEAVVNGQLTELLDIFGTKDSRTGAAVRSLDQEQLLALVEAWQDASDVTPGESPAS